MGGSRSYDASPKASTRFRRWWNSMSPLPSTSRPWPNEWGNTWTGSTASSIQWLSHPPAPSAETFSPRTGRRLPLPSTLRLSPSRPLLRHSFPCSALAVQWSDWTSTPRVCGPVMTGWESPRPAWSPALVTWPRIWDHAASGPTSWRPGRSERSRPPASRARAPRRSSPPNGTDGLPSDGTQHTWNPLPGPASFSCPTCCRPPPERSSTSTEAYTWSANDRRILPATRHRHTERHRPTQRENHDRCTSRSRHHFDHSEHPSPVRKIGDHRGHVHRRPYPVGTFRAHQ